MREHNTKIVSTRFTGLKLTEKEQRKEGTATGLKKSQQNLKKEGPSLTRGGCFRCGPRSPVLCPRCSCRFHCQLDPPDLLSAPRSIILELHPTARPIPTAGVRQQQQQKKRNTALCCGSRSKGCKMRCTAILRGVNCLNYLNT